MSLSGEASQPRDRHHSQPGGGGHHVERGFTAAFELVMTPALLGLIGYFMDRQFGTAPFFTLGLTAFTAVYVIWKLCHGYNTEMDRLEGERIERNVLGMLETEDQ